MAKDTKQWSKERIANWFKDLPWQVGCNYLPRTAVNFVDMWHPETFDAETIDEELGWAADIGFNLVRVNLQYVLWRAHGDAHKKAFDRFLEIASSHSIKTMPCLFDDCGFSGSPANSDRQPDPVPDLHNSRALASPGREIVVDSARRSDVLAFVREVLSAYAHDDRILMWDLFNEPGNASVFTGPEYENPGGPSLSEASFDLMNQCFDIGREVDPSQPLTVGAWRCWPKDRAGEEGLLPFQNQIDQVALERSDITTFHSYQPLHLFEKEVAYLEQFGRPMICTEWLARTMNSKPESHLPVMAGKRIGALNWGLVQGRTQTHIPWPGVKAQYNWIAGQSAPFHDIFNPDGTPFYPAETKLFRDLSR